MKTFAFIDASNLFYGGEKSLGWKIDYQKLFEYLKEKYSVSGVSYNQKRTSNGTLFLWESSSSGLGFGPDKKPMVP